MAQNVYLELSGATQGPINGDSTRVGNENHIECVYYQHDLIVPVSKGSGQATGRRRHGPIIVRKRIEKASPKLTLALINNELVAGTFRFFRPSPSSGVEEHFFTVQIEGGRVVSLKQVVPDTFVPATASQPPLEEAWFVFARITWTIADGNITTTDTVDTT